MKPALVVCMGVSGCGKSTVGRAIAAERGVAFLEADDFHSRDNLRQMASGLPLTDAMRAPWIDAICTALRAKSSRDRHCTLACSALRRTHRDRLRDTGFHTCFLFLDGSPELIAQWVRDRENHFMPLGLLDSQFATLESPLGENDVVRVPLDRPWEAITAECLSLSKHAFGKQ